MCRRVCGKRGNQAWRTNFGVTGKFDAVRLSALYLRHKDATVCIFWCISRVDADAGETLNVKNMPDALYRKLKARAKLERRSVAQQVTEMLSHALETPEPLSILALQGLGKEHWQGVDAAEHVERERRTWD